MTTTFQVMTVVWDSVTEEHHTLELDLPIDARPTSNGELPLDEARELVIAANKAYCEMYDEDNTWTLASVVSVGRSTTGCFRSPENDCSTVTVFKW
jgi:hypothetical protein